MSRLLLRMFLLLFLAHPLPLLLRPRAALRLQVVRRASLPVLREEEQRLRPQRLPNRVLIAMGFHRQLREPPVARELRRRWRDPTRAKRLRRRLRRVLIAKMLRRRRRSTCSSKYTTSNSSSSVVRDCFYFCRSFCYGFFVVNLGCSIGLFTFSFISRAHIFFPFTVGTFMTLCYFL